VSRLSQVFCHMFLVFAVLANAPSRAQDIAQDIEPLPIGEGDRVRLKVFGQPDLSDVFEIGRGGQLSLPGLGTATGLHDLEQARKEVGALIDRKFGLPDTAFSLTIDRLRPVIVGGNVSRPGEIAFTPGMRVAHALALAGQGRRANDDVSIELQINEGRERLISAKARLARALVKEQRLVAEMRRSQAVDLPAEAKELIGEKEAGLLFATERRTLAARLENRAIALRRIDASAQINREDISSQEAVSQSLRTQLELVQGDLKRLEPLFADGSITSSRILELRRDYVEIQGQVGQTVASLAQARARQAVLSEESAAYDLQLRLELLGEVAGVQFEILDARASIKTISSSLEAAGAELPAPDMTAPASCRLMLLRDTGASTPTLIAAEPLTRLRPGDLLFVGRTSSRCPTLAEVRGAVE
jgi:protein involved in polysaccharide export with SLBB domain